MTAWSPELLHCGGRGRRDQWEAWNWSCFLRANERPRKNGTRLCKQTHKQTWRLYDWIGPMRIIQWKTLGPGEFYDAYTTFLDTIDAGLLPALAPFDSSDELKLSNVRVYGHITQNTPILCQSPPPPSGCSWLLQLPKSAPRIIWIHLKKYVLY